MHASDASRRQEVDSEFACDDQQPANGGRSDVPGDDACREIARSDLAGSGVKRARSFAEADANPTVDTPVVAGIAPAARIACSL